MQKLPEDIRGEFLGASGIAHDPGDHPGNARIVHMEHLSEVFIAGLRRGVRKRFASGVHILTTTGWLEM